MSRKIKVLGMDAYLYREVWQILKDSNGYIISATKKGYCREDRPILDDEKYTSLSTKLSQLDEFEIELLD